MAPKTILILTASPDDEAKLRADKEIKAIEDELERSKYKDNFKIIDKLAVKPDDLDHVLQKVKPEIIHFCGHGKEEGLVLENDAEKSHVVPLEALADLISKFKNTECVVLNACYSDAQAKKLKEYVCVIGMKEKVEDTAAIKFATHFYGALFAGYDYKNAYDFGKIALHILRIQDDLLPKILEKSQPITSKQPLNPPTRFHYNNVINAFKSGRVIPFLGSGINLCDGQALNQIISDIQLADYLARDLGMADFYQDLVGSPCPVCPVSAENLPADCPVKKALLEGTTAACPLANEQALAVAKLNLQCLAQYVKLTSNIQDVYQRLQRLHELFGRRYSPNKLHEFFANLPEAMQDKGYRRLPYQLLVTTNYDDMLERAFKKAGQRFDLVFYVAEGEETQGHFQYRPFGESVRPITSAQEVLRADRPLILKLYGAISKHDDDAVNKFGFVIAEDHHINYLVKYKIDQLLPYDLLELLWESHNILFMGYSPNDMNLRLIINRLWEERKIGQKSWMIHQSKPGELDKEFWRNRNVQLLDSDLEKYLTELNKKIEDLNSLNERKSLYERWEKMR